MAFHALPCPPAPTHSLPLHFPPQQINSKPPIYICICICIGIFTSTAHESQASDIHCALPASGQSHCSPSWCKGSNPMVSGGFWGPQALLQPEELPSHLWRFYHLVAFQLNSSKTEGGVRPLKKPWF